jgi:hypothetical protein
MLPARFRYRLGFGFVAKSKVAWASLVVIQMSTFLARRAIPADENKKVTATPSSGTSGEERAFLRNEPNPRKVGLPAWL